MISNAFFHKRELLKKKNKNQNKNCRLKIIEIQRSGWGIPRNSKIACFGVIVCYRVNFYSKELSALLLQRIMWVIKKIDYKKYSPFKET